MVMHHRRSRAVVSLAAVAALSMAFAGCGSNDEGGTTGATGGATGSKTTIEVSEQEFAILPASASAPAGDVTFNVTNTGPDEVHEFVVLATDLAPDALPTNKDGSADEEGTGVEPVDELEDIAVGDTASLTVSLDPGTYVFICNIVDKDTGTSHYYAGMRVGFTVE